MSFAFACTWLVPSPYDHEYAPKVGAPKYLEGSGSMTLHWGGDFTHQSIVNVAGRIMSLLYIPYDWITPFMTWALIQVAACAHSVTS